MALRKGLNCLRFGSNDTHRCRVVRDVECMCSSFDIPTSADTLFCIAYGRQARAKAWVERSPAARINIAACCSSFLCRWCRWCCIQNDCVATRETQDPLPDTKCRTGGIYAECLQIFGQNRERRRVEGIHERQWHELHTDCTLLSCPIR